MKVLREVWDNLREFVATVGAVALFLARVLAQVPRALLRFRLVVEQVHNAGALSLVIMMTCGRSGLGVAVSSRIRSSPLSSGIRLSTTSTSKKR